MLTSTGTDAQPEIAVDPAGIAVKSNAGASSASAASVQPNNHMLDVVAVTQQANKWHVETEHGIGVWKLPAQYFSSKINTDFDAWW